MSEMFYVKDDSGLGHLGSGGNHTESDTDDPKPAVQVPYQPQKWDKIK